ncbi:metal-binding protein [Chamaesiphon sp. OTE_8_metabat_110]|uniref:metal-binding protein n=1 Tax=Chamaesiphon sp. OTE_8_metabat_110 TaxID=2964696 RepID=UPI00286CB21B|nr:metal-binding protein [Chamaesiphon sp. OTE_8_metabat_110]
MPSGRTHDRVTLWSLPLIAGGTLWTTARADLAFWVSGGFLFSGLIFGPDLDLYSFHYKRWGKLRWLWRPYQQAIKHRSICSHGPIIGTIGRIFYLSLWLALVGLFYLGIARLAGAKTYTGQELVAILQHSIANNFPVYLALFCGLELGAMSHYVSDWLVSTFKRRFRNGQPNPKLSVASRQKKLPVKQAKKIRVK